MEKRVGRKEKGTHISKRASELEVKIKERYGFHRGRAYIETCRQVVDMMDIKEIMGWMTAYEKELENKI